MRSRENNNARALVRMRSRSRLGFAGFRSELLIRIAQDNGKVNHNWGTLVQSSKMSVCVGIVYCRVRNEIRGKDDWKENKNFLEENNRNKNERDLTLGSYKKRD